MHGSIWILFILLITFIIFLDLGVFHRRNEAIKVQDALIWTIVWIGVSLAFNVFIYFFYEGTLPSIFHEVTALDGRTAALQYFTGYIIEKSLSIDNIFVIALVFSYFNIPLKFQHRVLFWGISGAIVMRAIMILAGTAMINKYSWIIYIFGALLIYSAIKMLFAREEKIDPSKNPVIRFMNRFMTVSTEFEGAKFFSRSTKGLIATPLFVALVMVEVSDIMFAIDSIPAIFAVTKEPFIVFTSNIFAILGLRSLYFAIAGMMDRFRYLKTSLAFLLGYVGTKMLLSHYYHIPTQVSLGIIFGILFVGVIASMAFGHKDPAPLASPLERELSSMLKVTLKQGKRLIILIIGLTVLLIGLIMVVLPGPATLMIPAGLGILAIEFTWARRWLNRIKDGIGDITRSVKERNKSK